MRLPVVVLVCLTIALTGCGMGPTVTPTAEPGAAIHGVIHGGQNPLSGAQLYLFAAASGGYGLPSTSLLQNVSGSTTLDTGSGPTGGDYYVTSDANGSFTISGDYNCPAGSQVYLYALGGNPGLVAGNNSASGMMAVLGQCPTGGSLLSVAPHILINEVTTVAAAYALSGFATDATHVSSSGTPLALVGIANAFANAGRLATLATGSANAVYGAATVPQAQINTLANILASCVNSAGPSSLGCSTLFSDARSAGSSGTIASDTATAAINLAHNPLANVAQLYALAVPSAAFAPGDAVQPADFTVDVIYTAAISPSANILLAADSDGSVAVLAGTRFVRYSAMGVPSSAVTTPVNSPVAMAVDPTHNLWVADDGSLNSPTTTSGFIELNSSGYVQRTVFDPTLTGLTSVAIDPSLNVWGTSYVHNTVVGVSSTGTLLPTSGTYVNEISSNSFTGLAVLPTGDLWIAAQNGAVHITGPTNSATFTAKSYGAGAGTGIAIDHLGRLWIVYGGFAEGTVVLDGSTGALLSPSNGYTGGGSVRNGYFNPQIDGAGTSWNVASDYGDLSAFSSAGVGIGGKGLLSSLALRESFGPALDGSGNVWVAFYAADMLPSPSTFSLVEVIGAAAPVVTPLSAGVVNNTLGTLP